MKIYFNKRNLNKMAEFVHDTAWQVVMDEKDGKEFKPFAIYVNRNGSFPRVKELTDEDSGVAYYVFNSSSHVYALLGSPTEGIISPEEIKKIITRKK